MTANRLRALATATPLAILAALCMMGSDLSVDPGFLELRELAEVQQANRSRISSYHLVMREQSSVFSLNGGEMQQHIISTLHTEVRKGVLSRISRDRQVDARTLQGTSASEDKLRMLIGEDFLAHWFVGNPVLYLYEFESQDSWPDEVRRFAKVFNPRTPERYGFGDGSMTLSEWVDLIEAEPDSFRLSVEALEDTPGRFHLTFSDAPNGNWSLELWVQSDRGASICAVKEYSRSKLVKEITVSVEETDGVWFPHRWTVRRYAQLDNNKSETALIRESVNELTSLRINLPLDDSEFTLSALQPPENTLICRKDRSGNETAVRLVAGELVPSVVAPGSALAGEEE